MAFFYFFKKDGRCCWVEKELREQIPKYLHEPVDYQGSKTKFYLILKWITNDTRGANLKALDEARLNYVKSVEQLPEGAGIFITGYDADVEELEAAREKGVPIIERPCPWVRQLRNQIMKANPDSHQCVIMIDKDHMVYDCYKSIFPEDTIIVQPDNYEAEIKKHKNGKPVNFMVYATFRKKDAEQVIKHINTNYGHPDNLLDGYRKTVCNWVKQGLLEEIDSEVRLKGLGEVWVICSSEGDRSTKSILKEIKEAGSNSRIIKDIEDVPKMVGGGSRIGVLFAPIPLSTKVRKIKDKIRERFCQ